VHLGKKGVVSLSFGCSIRGFPPLFYILARSCHFSFKLNVISYVLSLCYGIWFARNKSCFDGKQILAEDIVCKAWTIVDDYNLMSNTLVISDNPEPSNSPIS
jgi:hypothetical protein